MANRWEMSRVVSLIDGRWTLAVLAELRDGGGCRFQELDDALDGVSHKVLTDTLRRAERDGLVARHLDPGRVDTATLYQLTDLGRSLEEPFALLGRWSEINWPHVEAARRRWGRRSEQRSLGLEPASGPCASTS
jgi:DNA-binding HxlR family transcriptional regulator